MLGSPLLRGLALTLRNPRPLLWAFFFNAAIAWITSLGLRAQYANVVTNSLAAQRLIGGFDLGVAVDAARRLGDGPPGNLIPSILAVPIYLLVFFLLVPGTLHVYQTNTPLRFGGLLQAGVQSFWSFVRIVLVMLAIAAPILALLSALQSTWSNHVDETITGRPAFLLDLIGVAILFLVACLLRLYFDLVEIHAVALAQHLRPCGRADRRIRTTLKPALQTLRSRFLATYVIFVGLAMLGALAMYLFSLAALHRLAQPSSWPVLLLAQLGIFSLIFTRFWQRAAETAVFRNANPIPACSSIVAYSPGANPAPPPRLEPTMTSYASTFPTPDPISDPLSPILPGPASDPMPGPSPLDPLPGPEPISPSLAAPDPGIFGHEVTPPAAKDRDLLN